MPEKNQASRIPPFKVSQAVESDIDQSGMYDLVLEIQLRTGSEINGDSRRKNADFSYTTPPVGVLLIMCKPTTLLHGFDWFLKQYCTIAPTALACVYVL